MVEITGRKKSGKGAGHFLGNCFTNLFKFRSRSDGIISFSMSAKWCVVFIGVIFLCGCGAKIPLVGDDEPGQHVILHNAPKSIAVLPFGNRTENEELDEFVRTTFYGHLSAAPYKDVELHEIDRKLKRYGLMDYDKLSQVSARRLGRILHCDAVVIGEVIEYQRLFAGLYSQMAVGASIRVWDTRTGKKIWSDEHVTRNHSGGIPLALTDIAMIGIRSGLNLTESEKVATVDELSRYLTNRIPVPDLNDKGKGSKLVSLKRLTKKKRETSQSTGTKLRSLKNLTKGQHPQYR